MSEHIERAIAEFETTIAKLTTTVENLRWFQREFPHTAAAVVPVEKSRRTYKTRTAKRLIKRTNERTNEAKPGPRPRAHRSLPDDAKLQAIVGVLNKHGGSMKPGMLADALAIDIHVLRYQMKPFLESGALTVSGATLNRLVHVGKSKAAMPAPKPNGSMKPPSPSSLDEVESRDRNVLLRIKGAGTGGRSIRELMITLGETEGALISSVDRLRIKKQIKADDNGKWVSA
jgi:hypothetical protein